MGTRICHADADTDADSNGIRTETNMSPPPLCVGGGHNKSMQNGINEFVKCEKSDNIVKR